MDNNRWVASGIEIKTFNEYESLNELILDGNDIGKVVEEFTDYLHQNDNEKVHFDANTVCIENGLVLPKDRDSLSITLDDDMTRHLMYCEPVREVPGLYSVIDTVVDLNDDELLAHDNVYYAAIDAAFLAEKLEIPQRELEVVQKTLLDKDNNILDVIDNSLETNKKWYDSGIEIKNIDKYIDFEKGVECPFYKFGTFAKRIVSTKDPAVLKDMFINSGLILPEDKKDLQFFIGNTELKHTITCIPVKDSAGLYYATDVVKSLRLEDDFENKNEYFVAINARRLAKFLEIPDKELKVVKESLVDVHNKVIEVRDKEEAKIKTYISLKPKKTIAKINKEKENENNSFEK